MLVGSYLSVRGWRSPIHSLSCSCIHGSNLQGCMFFCLPLDLPIILALAHAGGLNTALSRIILLPIHKSFPFYYSSLLLIFSVGMFQFILFTFPSLIATPRTTTDYTFYNCGDVARSTYEYSSMFNLKCFTEIVRVLFYTQTLILKYPIKSSSMIVITAYFLSFRLSP